MNILAIETSGHSASLCALRDASILHISPQPSSIPRTARWLTPAIQALLQQVSWRPNDVDGIAVTVGPGSFTGLRIGITTAKVFAYAAETAILGVDTHDALAFQSARDVPLNSELPLHVIVDAQRHELFLAKYASSRTPIRESPTRIVAQTEWLASLRAPCVVHGPGLLRLRDPLPPDVIATPESTWQLMASSVGQLASQRFADGYRDDLWRLKPNYGRVSAAEEKS